MARALGRYELLRPLARGGMAEVYLARRRAAGIEKWLVVKRMRPETSGDPRFLDLFVREARLSMSLVHQNIVPVFDFGRIDDQVFLAMERVEGKDLGSSLARTQGRRLPPLLASFIAAECCQALDYAHQRRSPDGVALGVVHRDVTPRNVLLSWSGEVKLTDFGIAALAGDATSRLLGTPQYMAPEQARSEAIDPRADVYALGLILREAVTGVRARPGGDREAILDAARRGVLVPWPSRAPALAPPGELALGSGDHGPPEAAPDEPPARLVEIIDRATAAAPADRYPDARSMLEELDRFILGERAAHRAESPARQLAAWLAAVWEGARDDAEIDATIGGDHLVSFLDDGALELIGTGTVRSLAATVAEEVQPAPAMPDPAPAPAPAAPTSPPAAAPPALRPSEPLRQVRITSSASTVASGSFHTIPTRDSDELGSTLTDRRSARARRRAVVPLVSVVLGGIATGAVAFFVMNNYRERTSSSADPPAPALVSAAPPSTGRPAAPPPSAQGTNAATPPTPAPPDPAPAKPGRTGSGSPQVGAPGSGSSRDGAERPSTGRPRPAAPSAPARTGSPRAGSQQPERAERDGRTERTERDGSAGAAQSPGAPLAACRVRINLTPWAFFTADEDPTRHETPSTVDLAPGRHRLHVWNPELHVERDITITVPADRETMNFSEPLQATKMPSPPGQN
ncbi:MAG TPA: serine/threonine-protein kinase [Kofleriaceae bacterium]|nr:serine/threonine-protein kinase [Kofleriaceae bacterium]